VTLAEIYAAQGHFDRALNMLEEVLKREPEHEVARALRERLRAEREPGPERSRKRRAPEPAAHNIEAEAEAWDAPSAPAEPEPAAEVAEVSEAEVQIPATPAGQVEAREAPAQVGTVAPDPDEPAVVLLREGDRAYVYWEVPSQWLELGGNGTGRRTLLARAVGFSPSEALPVESIRDFEPAERFGGAWISLRRGEVVRAALGYLKGERFSALAVASELSVSPSGAKREFCPIGSPPSDLAAVEARASAHLQAFRG
jgi:hypothetical protein